MRLIVIAPQSSTGPITSSNHAINVAGGIIINPVDVNLIVMGGPFFFKTHGRDAIGRLPTRLLDLLSCR